MSKYKQCIYHLGCAIRHLWHAIEAMPIVFAIAGILLVFALAGCTKNNSTSTGAPSGDYTKQEATNIALIALAGRGGSYGLCSNTRSMIPILDHDSIVILCKPTSPIVVGDIVSFDRGDVQNVLHRVIAANDTHLYISGDNNRYSDGWYPRTVVNYRLNGIIYTKRDK